MTTLNFQRLGMLPALVLFVLVCGSSSAQEKPAAITAPSTQKVPEYFGIFARMKDGSLIELERKQMTGASKMRPLAKIPQRYYFMHGWLATFGHPAPEIDLLQVDHFIVNFDKFIDDKSCALQEFHSKACFSPPDDIVFDNVEPFALRLADYNTVYCSLGGALDSRHGLRTAKIGERTYKIYFPDPAKQQAAWDDLQANRTVGELPVSVLGIYWEDVCYQFRLKRPGSNEPKSGTFALDINKYRGKTIDPELGDSLTLAEDKATNQMVITAPPGGVFRPANLAIKGDFTITAKMVFLRENVVFELHTDKSHILLNQERDRYGNGAGFHFELNHKNPPKEGNEKGNIKTITFKRSKDVLQVTAQGTVFDPITLPADEVVETFSIGGFTTGMGIADFTITTP